MEIIDGKKIAAQIKEELKLEIEKLKARGEKPPGLAVIIVGNNPASKIYVNSKRKACEKIGMLSTVIEMPEDASESELLEMVKKFNGDDNYHGILVQLPLPKHIDEDNVIDAIDPSKDVDGFHPFNVGNLVIGKETFYPCTPNGIFELLKRYNIETRGKHVVVVGRSNIVGKPAANMALQKKSGANAIVTVCHSAARDLSYYTKQADILIAAIGKPNFIKEDMVKNGATVIDVGINRVEDKTTEKGYRVVGDVDFENVAPKTSFITPVPGGVGAMTIAMLLKNTFNVLINLPKIF